jgi:hypothetical protein
LDLVAPIATAELQELLTLIRDFRKEDEEVIQNDLPEVPSLAEPQLLNELVLKENQLATKLSAANQSDRDVIQNLARAPREFRESLEEALRDFASSFDSVSEGGDVWAIEAAREVLLGKHLAWQELYALTTRITEEIANEIDRVARFKILGIDTLDRAVVRADAEAVRSHLLSGKSIGLIARHSPFMSKRVKSALYLTTVIRINGRLLTTCLLTPEF